MTAEEKIYSDAEAESKVFYPNNWQGKNKAEYDDYRLEREGFNEGYPIGYKKGWNDRDSLVEAEKKEAVDVFKEKLLSEMAEQIFRLNVMSDYRSGIKAEGIQLIIKLLTPEDK